MLAIFLIMNEPLTTTEAKKLVAVIVATGTVVIRAHARKRMAERNVAQPEILRALANGIYLPAEQENGEWRYGARAFTLLVVVSFASETELHIVTVVRYT